MARASRGGRALFGVTPPYLGVGLGRADRGEIKIRLMAVYSGNIQNPDKWDAGCKSGNNQTFLLISPGYYSNGSQRVYMSFRLVSRYMPASATAVPALSGADDHVLPRVLLSGPKKVQPSPEFPVRCLSLLISGNRGVSVVSNPLKQENDLLHFFGVCHYTGSPEST